MTDKELIDEIERLAAAEKNVENSNKLIPLLIEYCDRGLIKPLKGLDYE